MFAQIASLGSMALVVGILFLVAPHLPLEGIRMVAPDAARTVAQARLVGAFLAFVGAVVIEVAFAVDNPLPPELHAPAIGVTAAVLLALTGALLVRFPSDVNRLLVAGWRLIPWAAVSNRWMTTESTRTQGIVFIVVAVFVGSLAVVAAVLHYTNDATAIV